MHTLILATVNAPKYEIDTNIDKLISDDLEHLKKMDDPAPAFISLHKKELFCMRESFANTVGSATCDLVWQFSEDNNYSKFAEFYDLTDDFRQQYENESADCFKHPNGSYFSSRSRFGLNFIIGDDNKVYQAEYGRLGNKKRSKKAKKLKAIRNYPFKKMYKTFEAFLRSEHYWFYDKEHDSYGYMCNPKAFYDWFAIGGRWPFVFLVKEDCSEYLECTPYPDMPKEKPAPKGYIWVCAARKKDIQWKEMYKYSKEMAEKDYNMFKKAFEERTLPEGVHGNITDEGISNFNRDLYVKDETFPEYLSRNRIIRKYKYPSFCYGFIEGDDYVLNECWDGDRNVKERIWHKKICRFIDSLDDETVLVGVDCHM